MNRNSAVKEHLFNSEQPLHGGGESNTLIIYAGEKSVTAEAPHNMNVARLRSLLR